VSKAKALAGPVFLLVITALYFWKITLTDEFTWLESPDLAYQVLPWFQVEAAEWRQWHPPLWDPYHWSGQPLIGQAQPGVAYPLNWLLFRAPLHDGWIRLSYLNWYFVLIHFMAALFCYLLCRDLRRSKLASIIAGCSYAFGGFMGSNDWPQMINGAVWIPLVLMFLLRVGRGVSPVANAAFAGSALGMAWLSGHHQIPIFVSLAAGFYWLYLILREKRVNLRMAALAALFGAMMLCVGALQTLPAYEYGSQAKRWVGVDDPIGWKDKVPYQVHQNLSSGPLSVLGILFPSLARNSEAYAGIVAFSLALAGFFAMRRKNVVRVLAAIAVGGFLYGLGSKVVEHGMLYSLIPMLEKARTPAMAMSLFHAALAPLLAFGVDAVAVRSMKPLRWALLGGAGLMYLFIMGFSLAQKNDLSGHLVFAPLVALLLAGLLALWARGEVAPDVAKAGILALLLLELGNYTTYNYAGKYDKGRTQRFLAEHPSNSDIVTFLKKQERPLRVMVDEKELAYNFGDWYGVETANGYLASLSQNLQELRMFDGPVRDLFAVNYEIRKTPNRPEQVEVFSGVSGLKVFKNPTALPRAWVVHEVRSVGSRRELPQDPRREATIFGPLPKVPTCSDNPQTQWITRSSQKYTLKVQVECRGLLVIADTYFPGWVAKVDGAQTPVLEVNGAQRGVVVDAGVHNVELAYRPTSVMAGAALTGFGWLATLGIWLWKRKES